MAIDAFMAPFLDELHAHCFESSNDVRGQLENALHQRLQSCGDKKKQARQLNAVAKGSSQYMDAVTSKFVKNFDKFDLYMRRNIVTLPHGLAGDVEALYTARQQSRRSSNNGEGKESKKGSQSENEIDPSLSREEQQEKQLGCELGELRRELRELTEKRLKLELEHRALEENAKKFTNLAAEMQFLDNIPSQTVSPLKRAVNQVDVLYGSFKLIDGIQERLESEMRESKRAKTESRASFENLHTRFLANSTAVSFASSQDLQALHSRLASM